MDRLQMFSQIIKEHKDMLLSDPGCCSSVVGKRSIIEAVCGSSVPSEVSVLPPKKAKNKGSGKRIKGFKEIAIEETGVVSSSVVVCCVRFGVVSVEGPVGVSSSNVVSSSPLVLFSILIFPRGNPSVRATSSSVMCSSLPSWTRREQLRASKLLSSHHASFPVGKGLPLLIVMDPTDGCALSSSSPRLTSGSDPLGGCSLSSKSSSDFRRQCGGAAARRSSRRRLRGCDDDGCGGVPGDVLAAADSDDCFLLAATATRLRTATAAFLLAATATPFLLRWRRLDDRRRHSILETEEGRRHSVLE
nr:protein FAR1-RELATED SEQUENCE 5-like [Ipomoea batatas]